MTSPFRSVLFLATFLLLAAGACGQIWSDEFATHSPDAGVYALLHHDDGGGLALYIGGEFTRAGVTDCRGVARWTGNGWAPLGAGVEGRVTDMASMRIDGQPALIVAGEITSAGGEPTEALAVWMDESWHTFSAASALGPGVSGAIDSIEVIDDGAGDRLVVAGQGLGTVGGLPVTAFAAWDGREWTDLSGGLHALSATTLESLAFGGKRSLYAAGAFAWDVLGLEQAGAVLRRDGGEWTVVSGDLWPNVPAFATSALAVYETAAGEALYYATSRGFFTPCCSIYLARWTGESWETIPNVRPARLGESVVLAEAPGVGLLLGNLAQWPSHYMSYIGPDGGVYDTGLYDHAGFITDAMAVEFEPGKPETLLATSMPSRRLFSWNLVRYDGVWRYPLSGAGPNERVAALERASGPWGDSLFLGGEFATVGGAPAPGFARLDGGSFIGIDGLRHASSLPRVWSLCSAVVDGEQAVIVGGWFDSAGGLDASAIAAWTATGWRTLGEGLSAPGRPGAYVYRLITAPTPQGEWVIAAGSFTHSGAEPMANIAAWDGERWLPLGHGLPLVSDVCWFDDGAGGALYATSRDQLFRFDGDVWQPVATVTGGELPRAGALAVWPGAAGPDLVMSGSFESVTGGSSALMARNLAAWNGASWRNIGELESSGSLRVLDTGAGPRLWAMGQFQSVNGTPTDRVAVWDGNSWEAIGSPGERRGPVEAAEVFEFHGKPRVFLGGGFTQLDGVPAGFLTYQLDAPCRADLDGDGQLTFFDFLVFSDLFAAGDPRADFDGDGELTFFDFLAFSNEFAAGCP